jgi:restriction endonuclease Mrr
MHREHVRGGDHLSATLAYRITATRHPFDGYAADAMKGIFCSPLGFTHSAEEFAASQPLELWDGKSLLAQLQREAD